MDSVLGALQLFAATFVGSLGLAYGFTRNKIQRRKQVLEHVPPDTGIKLRSVSGLYRARIQSTSKKEIVISSPMQRDYFVPLRVDEEVTIEVPVERAVMTFRTKVIGRDPDSHTFTLAMPDAPTMVNRRQEIRSSRYAGEQVFLNDEWAELIDVSASGARVVSFFRAEAGDVVRVVIPQFGANQLAYVMECLPETIDSRQGNQLRLRFLDPLPPIPLKLRTQ